MQKIVTTISLDENVYRSLEEVTQETTGNRSKLIQVLVVDFINKYKKGVYNGTELSKNKS